MAFDGATFSTVSLTLFARLMGACRQSSSTKRAKIRPTRVGADCDWTSDLLPRPDAWPEAGQLMLPRNGAGVNEYLYVLSRRHSDAVRCAAPLAAPARREPSPLHPPALLSTRITASMRSPA